MSFLAPEHLYRGFIADIEKHQVLLSVSPPKENVNLYDLWAKEFSNFNKVNVCLSGGIDSQFVF